MIAIGRRLMRKLTVADATVENENTSAGTNTLVRIPALFTMAAPDA